MISFLIGTKAQLIKTFPLMVRLDRMGIPYRYIDTAQHGPLGQELRSILGLRAPDAFLAPPETLIERTADAVTWSWRVLRAAWRRRRDLFPERGIVVVHGDTLSTLLGLIIGKLCRQAVCHLEAGERTHQLLRPFPEEIIRRIVDRYSDLMLACGDAQTANLASHRRAVVNLRFNTLLDAVQTVAERSASTAAAERRILVSVHRYETITSRERLEFVVSAVCRLAETERIVFGLHPPTRRKLVEFGLLSRITGLPNVELRGLIPYPEFVQLIATSKFIMTDGGGPQEESYFLGTPCLLVRSETERAHPNVFMAEWDLEKVEWFRKHHGQFRRAALQDAASPSDQAVAAILQHQRQGGVAVP